ncbi:SAM-dependent methyltransferase [Kibdelosporangium aridum]|uniref:S-adenosyl methyltransferase n=1 Tax=Kibdelosporangium aridum TaxID=2030 RepID=A0A1Y5XQ54_KIBAR|nr:SAM-dependent methyltransferase [Kibdelosporangium aridum]SMD10940.1 S-adenosyl methyltransferase [Kibdelosporangium aridum]
MTDHATWIPVDIDVGRASPARVYDYLLGGSWNFDIDRMMAQAAIDRMPWVRELARHNRQFLTRAVRFCADAGVRQFLDLGSGMPTAKSVHEIARETDPGARVVYVEQEPVAVAHAGLILSGVDGVEMIGADMRDVDVVLNHPTTTALLDFDEPIAVLMASSLHYVLDAAQAVQTVERYMEAVVPGSYLVLSHISDSGADGADEVNRLVELSKTTSSAGVARSREWIEELLNGLEVAEPGVVYTSQWRPDTRLQLVRALPAHSSLLAAVARKP